MHKKHLGKILIWDSETPPPKCNETILLWSAFSDETAPHAVSIPTLIETNANKLKSQYLEYIYELGELCPKGRRLIDHLELRPGFSYWWMSQIVESAYDKSLQLVNILGILAFTNWAERFFIDQILLVTANRSLAESMRRWCANKDVAFEWRHVKKTQNRQSFRHIFKFTLAPIRAISWLLHYWATRYQLKGFGIKQWQKTCAGITFVPYLFNMLPDAANEGRYATYYFAHLPETLISNGYKTNWLHLYCGSELIPNSKKAAQFIHLFNKDSQGSQCHTTLDSFLSIRIILQTIGDWIKIALPAYRVTLDLSHNSNSKTYLWPLLSKDWRESFFGPNAISNLLFLNLFEESMSTLPHQQIGFYLQENQAWEMAFIYAWKAAGHGRLIGVPHSTVRFWDLRYFYDPLTFQRDRKNVLPMPDAVALNGPAATSAYLLGGYPAEKIVKVEALRFLYLANAHLRKPLSISPNSPMHLLVLGDYFERNTKTQLRLLGEAVKSFPHDLKITVKPHPARSVFAADYPNLKMQVVAEPVAQLLNQCHIAYTSSITAAAVDAYLTGVPVVTLLDSTQLNLSPLRGLDDVFFVSSAVELCNALKTIMIAPPRAIPKNEFFNLDKDLPRWRDLLT